MASLNKVMLIGNLTREPEVRYTPKGSAVCDLGIAVNRTYVTDSNERMQETTYVDVVVWSHLAELAGKYLHKGRAVFIEGRLQMDTWEDKATGQKRSKIRVVADNLQFLDSKRDNNGEPGAGGPATGGGNYAGGSTGGGGYSGGGGGGYQSSPAPRPNVRPVGQGGGGPAPRPAPQRQPAPDDFGDGPITDGMDDEIPF